jgi:hypothetical protein
LGWRCHREKSVPQPLPGTQLLPGPQPQAQLSHSELADIILRAQTSSGQQVVDGINNALSQSNLTHQMSQTCYPAASFNNSNQTVDLQPQASQSVAQRPVSPKPRVPQPGSLFHGNRQPFSGSNSRSWIGNPRFRSTLNQSGNGDQS